MIKRILFLIFGLVVLQKNVKAERTDTLIVYMKNSGQKVPVKDSADFYRVILPPDTTVDKDLYRIYDYYNNGKPKMFGTSFSKDVNLILDGVCVQFFKNGKRSSTSEFKNGRFTGTLTNYYPNGKIYQILKIDDADSWNYNRYNNGSFANSTMGYKVKLVELCDSTGKILAENGTGHALIYDDDFTKIIEEGGLKQNKREGGWTGPIADSGKFISVYHNGELKSGESFMKSGNHYTYKQIYVQAVYSDGMPAFYEFLKKNLQYPESARKHKIIGSVTIGFYIEINGTLSEIKVVRSLANSLDDEALRVMRFCPLWLPAYKYGIPFRTKYNVVVDFSYLH